MSSSLGLWISHLTGKRGFTDGIKDFELERFSWVIGDAQSDHCDGYERKAGGTDREI